MDPEGSIVTIAKEALDQAGFTNIGKQRFNDTVDDYVKDLFEKSKSLAEMNRGDLDPEITQEHVYTAARILAGSVRRRNAPGWILACQVCEYIAAAGFGVGTGQFNQPWGAATAFGCFVVGVLLLVLRVSRGKAD